MTKLVKILGLALVIAIGDIKAMSPAEEAYTLKWITDQIGSDCSDDTKALGATLKWENEVIRQNDDWRKPLLRTGFVATLKKYCKIAMSSEDSEAIAFIATQIGTNCTDETKVYNAILTWERDIISQNNDTRKPLLRRAFIKALRSICK